MVDWETGFDPIDIISILFGFLLFHFTTFLERLFVPWWPHFLLIGVMTALGVLFVLAPLLPVDWERHGRVIGAVVLLVFLLALVALYLSGDPQFVIDVQMFAAESAKSVVAGENPYTASYRDAIAEVGQEPTHRIDGTFVSTFSYPGGTALVLAPQYLLGIEDAAVLTVSVFAAGICVFLLAEAPDRLLPVTFLVLFGFGHWMFIGVLGGIGSIWVFPLLLGMYWWQRRPRAAAASLGWAAGVKQLVWPALAFVALWVWLDSADTTEFLRDAARYTAWGGGSFLVLNLPFVLMDPGAWLGGVLDPVFSSEAPLVADGWAAAVFTWSGTYALSRTAHLLLVALITLVAAGLYVRWWPRSRWAAFAVTPLILLGHYRFINTYFLYFMPVAYYAWIRHRQEEGVVA